VVLLIHSAGFIATDGRKKEDIKKACVVSRHRLLFILIDVRMYWGMATEVAVSEAVI